MTDELFDDLDEATFSAAVEAWGIDAQAEMAEEECAEFIVASKHWARGKADEVDVVDELADIRIMYEQLARFLGQGRVEQRVAEKMDRLRERLPDEHTPEPLPVAEPIVFDEDLLREARHLRHNDPMDPFEYDFDRRKTAGEIADEIDDLIVEYFGELAASDSTSGKWFDMLADGVATIAGVPVFVSPGTVTVNGEQLELESGSTVDVSIENELDDVDRPSADGAARCKHCEKWTNRYEDECQRCGADPWHETPNG